MQTATRQILQWFCRNTHLFKEGHEQNWYRCVEHSVKSDEPRLIQRLQNRERSDKCHAIVLKPSSNLCFKESQQCQADLSAEAIEKSKPNMHESEAARLKQEIAQEEGNAPVGPASMDQ